MRLELLASSSGPLGAAENRYRRDLESNVWYRKHLDC